MKKLIILGAVAIGILIAAVPSLRVIVVGHTQDAISRFASDQVMQGVTTARGVFDETAEGRDSAHWANGTVRVVNTQSGKRYIQLNTDFDSGPLPDGHVYYSSHQDINTTDDFSKTNQQEAGKLIKGSGASYYEIPHSAVVNSVTIYCKKFNVYIGSADMEKTIWSN